MIKRKVEWMASRDWVNGRIISLSGGEINVDHSTTVFEPVQLRLQGAGEAVRPFLTMTEDEAQGLMDALWNIGCRPSTGYGSEGQLAAVQGHLADMRMIAFKGLGIIGKEGV